MKKQTPLTIDGINESIYAGFWIRLASGLFDALMIIPLGLFVLYINSLNINFYYYTFLPFSIFNVWYSIYLVKRYGGTPGKLLLGIKILKIDGYNVTWREAILRQIVSFGIMFFWSGIMFYAIAEADGEHYKSLGWLKKQVYLSSLVPGLYTIYSWVDNIWIYSELFILLLNKRKRALHDFVAGTVIVKAKYIDEIRKAMN